ncbi:hypothetical protein EHF_0871 [Ehrlichia japonica]|uniref:Uncharacterized protein n=1 Tax=Ehrlichia japonica TaxID=391036 RepID=X5GKX4_9RICK|nr:hypothetical protein EHF_0871 [Ehrlichia japonica]
MYLNPVNPLFDTNIPILQLSRCVCIGWQELLFLLFFYHSKLVLCIACSRFLPILEN